MKRKGSASSSSTSSSSLSACSSAIAPPPGAKSKTYVEFHASMSLDNPASAMDYLTSAASSFEGASAGWQQQQMAAMPVTSFEHTTLEEVLKQRFHVWSRVHEVIETLTPLEAYACDVAALKKLQELHHLFNILPPIPCTYTPIVVSFGSQVTSLTIEISFGPQQRETHLRTLQLALLHERNLRTRAKGESGPVLPSPAAAHTDTALSTNTPSNEIKVPSTTTKRVGSNPDPVAFVGQLVEALETFDGDEAIDLFQLAM